MSQRSMQDEEIADMDSAGPSTAIINTISDNQIRLFYFILGYSNNSASVKIEKDGMVEDLRDAIIKKEGITDKAKLFKPLQPVTVVELQAVPSVKAEWRMLNSHDSLQQHFDPPPQSSIHIVVEHTDLFLLIHSWYNNVIYIVVKLFSYASRVLAIYATFALVIYTALKRAPKRPERGVEPWNIYVSREETVSALYEKLKKRRWVHVRGTPGSGKSVLAELLRRYVKKMEPYTDVVFVGAWLENLPVQTTPNTILILDEAQTTYWDKGFWGRFKNPGLQDMRVVAFASHGSSGYTGADNATPMWIGMEQRVGLARLDCGDGIIVGLLFTREEFNELVELRFRGRGFSDTFLDCVYDMTNGHVGAFQDLMNMIVAHESYRHRVKSAEYTYEMFITGVSMTDIPEAIYRGTVFGRGLPQDHVLRGSPDITAILNEVIRKESTVCVDDYLASDPENDDTRQAALRKIFRSGWLHTEYRADIKGILYTFASPLHRRCIDWQLNGLPLESRIIEPNLFEFALAIIQRFSRQSLEKREIGPKAQSIPEAQFQDEFYSSSSRHSKGSVSFPEFGTKNGRIDFFIRSKKWGVELLRDGNRLSQHARRFTEGEYGEWIKKGWMSDYIIIDFRTRSPRIVHRDVDKLVYVVSVDDWNTIEVLDNEGRAVGHYSLLNNY